MFNKKKIHPAEEPQQLYQNKAVGKALKNSLGTPIERATFFNQEEMQLFIQRKNYHWSNPQLPRTPSPGKNVSPIDEIATISGDSWEEVDMDCCEKCCVIS